MEPDRKPKVIYTDNSQEFGKSCEDLSWNHSTSTPCRSETNGIAERAVRRIKEGTCIVAIRSGRKWWTDSMECYCNLRDIQDLLSDGKMRGGSEYHSKARLFRLERWWNINFFLIKTCRNCICLARKSYQVYSWDMRYTRGESGKETYQSQTLRNWKKMDASEIHAKRLNAKEVLTSQRSGHFIFPVADGTVKIFGREQRLRTSTLTRDLPERENKIFFKEKSDELDSPTNFKTTRRGMMRKLKVTSGLLRENSFTAITLNPESNCKCREKRLSPFHWNIDVTRATSASLDVMLEKNRRLLARWWRSRIVRYVDSFHNVHVFRWKNHWMELPGPGRDWQ